MVGSKSGRVLARGRSERVDSILDDPEIDQQAARRLGVESALYVPLVVRQQPIGVVIAHDKLGASAAFTDDDVRLAETLSARAGTAVDLSERVSRDALRRVVEAQELERTRLARELHDETGQALTSMLLGLKSLEDRIDSDDSRAAAAELRELMVTTLRDVRRLAVELRPAALDDFGLVPALQRLRDTVGEQSEAAVEVESRLDVERLPPELETALYRIAQEALTNVVKHASATHVHIALNQHQRTVTLTVQDDGRGFESGAARPAGLGLVGMRERVALLGGWLTVESGTGAGTMLRAELPLP